MPKCLCPRPIPEQRALHLLPQLPARFARMVARTLVMHIAKRAPTRIGAGTGGRQVEQLKARRGREPRPNFLGVRNLGVIGYDREAREERHRGGPSERLAQGEEEAGLFAIPYPGGIVPVVSSHAPAR
jgi:hypothetical protein